MNSPTPYLLSHVWLVPLFPLATAAAMLFFGRRLGKSAVIWICSAGVGASLVISAGAFFELLALPQTRRSLTSILFDWIPAVGSRTASGTAAPFSAAWGFQVDSLSAVVLLVVTAVALLVHIYVAVYAREKLSYARFFGCMNLLVLAVLILVLADNSLVFSAGWGALGVSSFLLMGKYFRKAAARGAGKASYSDGSMDGASFSKSLEKLNFALGNLDGAVIDRVGVDGAGWLGRAASRLSEWLDEWVVDGAIRLGVGIVRLLAIPARLLQNGRVQSYILLFVIGLIGFLGYFAYLIHHAGR